MGNVSREAIKKSYLTGSRALTGDPALAAISGRKLLNSGAAVIDTGKRRGLGYA